MRPDDALIGLERHLAGQLRPLVSELRMIDPVILIDHVVNGRRAAMDRMIADAAELHFAPGFITYDDDADVRAPWSEAPAIVLGVRIATPQCDARIRLTIGGEQAAVELQNVEPCAGGAWTDRADLVRRAFAQNRVDAGTSTGTSAGSPRPPV